MDFRKYAKSIISGLRHQAIDPNRRELPTKLEQDIRVLFSEEYYVQENPDVAEAGADPLGHYLTHGMWEERQPSPLFSPSYYQEQIVGLTQPSVEHFLLKGGLEGLNPIPLGFDSRWYLDQHPEVARAKMNPLIHYLRKGWLAGYDPSPIFSVTWYRKNYPDVVSNKLDPLSDYIWRGFKEGRAPAEKGPRWAPVTETCDRALTQMARGWSSLRIRPVPPHNRITIVTDAIDSKSLFGGVATSIILASLWANATGRSLRILTRTVPPRPVGLHRLLSTMGIELDKPLELAYAPLSSDSEDLVPVSDTDIFLTTSWWSTMATVASIPPQRIVYLLQEDERAFYPVGSDWLRAGTMMNCPDISILVNTEGLLQHLIATGIDNLTGNGHAFTPSFSSFTCPGRRLRERGERPTRLCFYARPKNPRNLYDYGLAAIDQAFGKGLIDKDTEIVFLGSNLQELQFVNGTVSSVVEGLSWDEYREFIQTVDIGISLMASPHPSYPPLDMIASGAVVVTNTWPGKPSLSGTVNRIVEVAPTVDAITEGIAQAVALLHDVEDEPYDVEDCQFFHSWQENLQGSIEWAERRVTSV